MSQRLRGVARRIRYLEIPELIGSSFTIQSVESVPDDIHNALTRTAPQRLLPLIGPPDFNIRALAKYGILDIQYRIDDVLVPEGRSGLRLLEELGLLVRGERDEEFLEQFDDDVVEGRAFLKVFCRTLSPRELGIAPTPIIAIPPGYLPRETEIVDACVSNWDFVWFSKRFYL